jgi:hypothetical protein
VIPLSGYYPSRFITLKLEWSRFSLLWEESLLLRADGLRATSLEAVRPSSGPSRNARRKEGAVPGSLRFDAVASVTRHYTESPS